MVELTIIILALIGLLAWERHNNKKERARFINALIAKNAQEARDLNLVENTEVKVDKRPEETYADMDDLNDEKHLEAALKEMNKI